MDTLDTKMQLLARRMLCDTDRIEQLRAFCPKTDQELEHAYWYGWEGVPGSMVAAVYPLIKQHPSLSAEQIAALACADTDRLKRLAQNLIWEQKNRR